MCLQNSIKSLRTRAFLALVSISSTIFIISVISSSEYWSRLSSMIFSSSSVKSNAGATLVIQGLQHIGCHVDYVVFWVYQLTQLRSQRFPQLVSRFVSNRYLSLLGEEAYV